MKLFYGWVIVGVGMRGDLHRHGHDDVARRVPPADVAGHGLVPCRHLVRRRAQLPLHGLRIVPLGLAVRPVRHARRRAGRRRPAWRRAHRGQPCDDALQFQLLFGMLVGLAAGSFYAPLIATITRWFTRNRSLAVALVSSGMGLGSMLIAPLSRWIITDYDWRTAMLTVGCLALAGGHSRVAVRAPPACAGVCRRRRGSRAGGPTSPWRRCCARRSSPQSRSPTSPAARRIRVRSSTW